MRKIPSLWIGIIGCVIFAIFALFGPYLPKVDPEVPTHPYVVGPKNNLDYMMPPFPPNSDFLLGSDKKGRDIYSALVMGTRKTLEIVISVSLTTFLLGIPFGVAAAHWRIARKLLQAWNYLFSRIPVFLCMVFISTIPFFVFTPNRSFWLMCYLVIFELGKVGEVVRKSVELIQKSTYFEAGLIAGTKRLGLWRRYYWSGCYPQWLAYFIQHIGSILFLLGQLGLFGIFLSQAFFQTESPMYELQNNALVWPMFLFDVTIDFDAFPWIPLCGSLFITMSMFFFISLGEGILEYNLRKQRGLIVQRKPFLYRWKRIDMKQKSKSNFNLFLEEKGNSIKDLIVLDNVSKDYPGDGVITKALDSVNLSIEKGVFTAVIGPSGSGKSTLLSLIGALDKPTSGKIYFEREVITNLNNRKLANFRFEKIGFIFQQFHLLPTLTALENVMCPLFTRKVDYRKKERAMELLDEMGLKDKQNALPSQLSGGQQQRVAIARALVHHPDWILADEPTGNLDSESSKIVFDLLKRLNKEQGLGIILITHDPDLAKQTDRIIEIKDGTVISDTMQRDSKIVGL
ncbi:ATP-binding cassette domain-containing protein [Margalitia sp. FSL K6-0131]|uniref:ATP-binding cassette domain-containing protein n=1 Tax=Margalitia sp. FSL K6-0131 TaxID=2954604 RepID=UPI0030F8BB54